MANTVQVVFEIDKDQQGRTVLRQIDQGLDKIGQTAKQQGSGIESSLSFLKGAVILEFFRRGASAALEFGKAAVTAFNEAQAAALGLQSAARFRGLDPEQAADAVKNIELVKNGLLTLGDASTAVKNLLASGFSLEQSIELVNRFGDSAAFGRQSALSFGQAIVSATEGVKNQNSVLVDNAGVTKNLSVILKERGFELQDLSDKLKGASAREALYNGLLTETQAQVGDAAKLTNTFAGQTAQLEAQSQKLLVTLGEIITSNPDLQKGLQSVGTTLEFITAQLKDSDSALRKFVDNSASNIGILIDAVAKLVRGIETLAKVINVFDIITPVLNPGGQFKQGPSSDDQVIKQQFKKAREAFLEEQKKLESELKQKPIIAAETSKKAFDEQQEQIAQLRKSSEDYFKKLEEANKKYANEVRAAGDAVDELKSKLQVNPLLDIFDAADKRQREFLLRFQQVPKEIKDAFEKASRDVANLDFFRGVFAQGQNLNNLLNERAKLEAGGDPVKLAQLQKDNLDKQLKLARDFLGRSTSDAQRAFANQQIIDITSGGNLTSEQRDIRFQALNEQIVFAQKAFTENFNRLNEQTNATKENSLALVQVGNRLAQVEGALTNFADKPISIVVEEGPTSNINLGNVQAADN